jgi:hypothetical protein
MRIMKPLVPLSALAVAITVSTASNPAQAGVKCDSENGSAPGYDDVLCHCQFCQGTVYPDDRCLYCWDTAAGTVCYDRGEWATFCDPNDTLCGGSGAWTCAE